MLEKYLDFLNKRYHDSFRKATDDEINNLVSLGKNQLPEEFIELYRNAMPVKEIEISGIVFYPAERIIAENTDYVPGANILPYGLFTFASTADGDAVCIDLEYKDHTVFQCPCDLLSDETQIAFYKKQMISLPFNYKTITEFSGCIAENIDEFLEMLIYSEIELYSITEIIDNADKSTNHFEEYLKK